MATVEKAEIPFDLRDLFQSLGLKILISIFITGSVAAGAGATAGWFLVNWYVKDFYLILDKKIDANEQKRGDDVKKSENVYLTSKEFGLWKEKAAEEFVELKASVSDIRSSVSEILDTLKSYGEIDEKNQLLIETAISSVDRYSEISNDISELKHGFLEAKMQITSVDERLKRIESQKSWIMPIRYSKPLGAGYFYIPGSDLNTIMAQSLDARNVEWLPIDYYVSGAWYNFYAFPEIGQMESVVSIGGIPTKEVSDRGIE